MAHSSRQSSRNVALIGPGRAGTTLGLALVDLGWRVVAVAGRAPDAASTVSAVACLDSRAELVSEVGRDAQLVIIATPDRSIESAAARGRASIEPDTLVMHVAGSRGLDVFEPLLEKRPDVRVGAMHPLQSFPSTTVGLERLPGSWAAVAGDPQVTALAEELGLQPFTLADEERARYHATAVVAANHLVALVGQVERLAASCGVPFAAFAPLIQASLDNAFRLGPAHALTGPVERGDLATVESHLRALDPAERGLRIARSHARRRGSPAGATARSTGSSATCARRAGPAPANFAALAPRRDDLRGPPVERCRRAPPGPPSGWCRRWAISMPATCRSSRRARAETDFVWVTIFVNPLQFGPNEDLDRYPRDLANDLRLCEEAGVHGVFAPDAAEMYPRPSLTTVHVAGVTEDLCGSGAARRTSTVSRPWSRSCSRSSGRVARTSAARTPSNSPSSARMTADLDLPVEVVGCPLGA